MPRDGRETRKRLLDAACQLLAEESLSDLNIERISELAGVSRRTFFAHFPSKDHLLAEVVDHMRPSYLDRYRAWSDSCGPLASIEERLQHIFECITGTALDPKWKGSCFIRVSAELGNQSGHPVHAVVTAANRDMEKWLDNELLRGGYVESDSLARQLVVMINGLLMLQLVTRSTAYGKDIVSGLMRLLGASSRVTTSRAGGERRAE